MSNNYLSDKLIGAEKKFIASLDSITNGNPHHGTMGQETEKEWIKLFRNYLPARYAITSGIIIDHKNKISDEIDLIIYDPYFTPRMSFDDDGDKLRKIVYIPVESVYAAFEIKQKVSKINLKYAEEKSSSVACLELTSIQIKTLEGLKNPKSTENKIIYGILAKKAEWKDGLCSSSFSNLINKCKYIDFVITAVHGFYDASYLGLEKICTSQCSLFRALYRLFFRLAEIGNPPAIDCERYFKNLD